MGNAGREPSLRSSRVERGEDEGALNAVHGGRPRKEVTASRGGVHRVHALHDLPTATPTSVLAPSPATQLPPAVRAPAT